MDQAARPPQDARTSFDLRNDGSLLSQFSLEALGDLPGLEELKGTGLLDSRLPSGFNVPAPSDDPALREDEDPLDAGDLELALAPAVEPESGPESQ